MRTGERLDGCSPVCFWEEKDGAEAGGRQVCAGGPGWGWWSSTGREKKSAGGAPRPKHCRTFTRAKVAEALPEIVETFVEEAKKGSIAHAKMLTDSGWAGQGRGARGEEAAGEERGGEADGEDDAGAERGLRLTSSKLTVIAMKAMHCADREQLRPLDVEASQRGVVVGVGCIDRKDGVWGCVLS